MDTGDPGLVNARENSWQRGEQVQSLRVGNSTEQEGEVKDGARRQQGPHPKRTLFYE